MGFVFAKPGHVCKRALQVACMGCFRSAGNLRLGDTFCGLPPIGADAGFSDFKSENRPGLAGGHYRLSGHVQVAQSDRSAQAQQRRGFQRIRGGAPLVHWNRRNAQPVHPLKTAESQTQRGLQQIGNGVVVEHPKNRKIIRYRAARRLPRGMGRGARVPGSVCNHG